MCFQSENAVFKFLLCGRGLLRLADCQARTVFAITFCFCFLRHRGFVRHIEVKRGPDGCYGFAINYTTYPTLVALVQYYHENTLQVHNPELDTTLKFPLGSCVGSNS